MSQSLRRTVVYAMGREDCGKSSIISALINNRNAMTSIPHVTCPINNNERTRSTSSTSTFSSLSSSSIQSSQPDIVVHEWSPFHNDNDTDEAAVKQDNAVQSGSIQIWELRGTQLHNQAQLVYMRSPCLILVILDAHGDVNHNTDVLDMLNIVQTKCPGSHVIITISQSQNFPNDDNKEVTKRQEQIRETTCEWLNHRSQNIKKELLELESDVQTAIAKYLINRSEKEEKESTPSVKELFRQCTDCLHRQLQQGLHIHETVYSVNVSDGQGIEELRRTLIEKATESDIFPHLVYEYPDWIKDLVNSLQEMKENGNILLPANDFNELIEQSSQNEEKSQENYMKVCHQLEASGHILLLPQPSPFKLNTTDEQNYSIGECIGTEHLKPQSLQFVCINPTAFANMISNCLILNDKKTYKLEANRFWPRDSGFKPPDADLLARVLEALPNEGCIREAILPILWQDFVYDQTQILYMSQCLQSLGILMLYDKSVQDCAGLAMPHYSKLSAQTCHMSVLMDMIPQNKPQLNWTTKPFKDDLQITWKLSCVTSLSSSAIKRSLAYIKSVFQSCCDYIHIWDAGVLIKFVEAIVCVEDGKNALHISCRVNKEDEETIERSVQLLWIHLGPVVKAANDFLSCQMPGSVFKTKLSLFGLDFFYSKTLDTEPELPFVRCLMMRQFGDQMTFQEGIYELQINLELLFPFKDKSEWTPNDWLDLVLEKAKDLKLPLSTHGLQEGKRVSKQRGSMLPKKSSRKNKGAEIKWKTEVEEQKETSEGGDSILSSSGTPKVSVDESQTAVLTNQTMQVASVPDTTQISMTQEEWKNKASELACQFVSCTMALAVADFVALKSEQISGAHRQNIEAQVTVARITANATQAVHVGDLDAAARAVVEAVQAVEMATHGKSTKNMSQGFHQSRLCSIL